MTFKQFISQYNTHNSPLGDLVRDMECDPNFPETNDYNILLEYFSENLSDSSLEDFKKLYDLYDIETNF